MAAELKEHDSKRMNVKVLCQMAGISRSTLYQYLRSGLLHSPLNEGPTQLRYDHSHLKRLQEIRYFRDKKKLSLIEIQKIFQVSAPQEDDTEKNTADIKNMIVDKAIELVSEKGFAKTKISDIADTLNMGKGTFYLYFKNKEELFLKCIERFSDVFLPKEIWEEIRKERLFFKRSSKRIFYMLKSFRGFMGIVSIVKLAIRGTDADLSQSAKDCFRAIIHPVIKELERSIKGGEVRKVDTQFISFLLLGLGEAAGYWRMIHPECSVEKTTETVLDFVTYGLHPGKVIEHKEMHAGQLNGIVEDDSGTKVVLQRIRFDNQEQVSGKFGKGMLRLDLRKVMAMEIAPAGSGRLAKVIMISDEKVQIKIDSNMQVSGESPFGSFTIPMSDIGRITMSHG